MTKSSSLRLFSSPEHECSYLPDKCAKTHFIDPDAPLDSALYGYLLEQGFRRSGSHIYRPGCDSCQACIPLRLPVDRFRPKRNQRRAWTRSKSSLRITMRPPEFQEEHFELYNRYMQSRHPGDEMADATPDSYMDFLSVKWCETRFVELHLGERLAAVAVTDLLPRGLSSVYTFFEPELAHSSPGVLAVLWQIREAQRLKQPWLYLGYWVPGCKKMSYKSQYQPLQLLYQGQWREFTQADRIQLPGVNY